MMPTHEDHQRAMTELSFLVDIFSTTVDDLMGGVTTSVGRIAGRKMAQKLPLYFAQPKLDEVLDSVSNQLSRGFDISFEIDSKSAELLFERCAIREICNKRNAEPGGRLCQFFHYYFDGIVNELLRRPTRSHIVSCGDRCVAKMEIRQ